MFEKFNYLSINKSFNYLYDLSFINHFILVTPLLKDPIFVGTPIEQII